ncbi:methyl-accepting chemotaxis protein, partial [Blastococcus sp. URHD0036]|uniref:HAMP domain-containing methyl-accepting chemotaxis protein n=1 Tax=Blastococcus sp. URHD0036 TaxID=1380356 RepID=UPI000496EBA7
MSVRLTSSGPRRRGGWFADRPIGMKIGLVVGLLAVVVIATNLLAVSRIGEMRDGQERIYSENLQPLNALSAVQRATAAHRARVLEYAVSDPARRVELLGEMGEKQADVDAALAEYEPFVVDQAAIDKYETARQQFLSTTTTQLFPAADTGDLALYAQVYRDVSSPLLTDIADGLEEEGLAQSAQAVARNTASEDEANSAVTLLLVTSLTAVVLAVGLTVVVVRRMVRNLQTVQRSAEALAAGDLTVSASVDGDDEVGRMAAALDAAQQNLRSVMSSVVGAADAVAASSEELSASSAQISASANETSAQSGVVAGAAEEVSRSVQTVAAGA